jgi:hypothetical protein
VPYKRGPHKAHIQAHLLVTAGMGMALTAAGIHCLGSSLDASYDAFWTLLIPQAPDTSLCVRERRFRRIEAKELYHSKAGSNCKL